MATLLRVWNGTEWTRYMRTPSVPNRDELVGGTYVPSASTTGPIGALTDMYASAGATLTATKGLGAGYVALSAGTYEGLRIWAQVRASGPITLRNCEIVGQDPNTFTGLTGLVRNFAAGVPHITFEDCRITQLPWTYDHPGRPLTAGTVRTVEPRSFGIHGGNFTLRRSEITGVQDGVNYVQNGWVVGSTVSNCLVEQSWIHGLPYQNDWTGPNSPSNKQTHNDCFQTNCGKNIVIRYNMLGGWREQSGYDPWPGGTNTGDDAFSSILQLQQETSGGGVQNSIEDRIENVDIRGNWIDGGQYGINMYWRSGWSGQDFSSWSVVDNKFIERPAGVRWGPSLNDPDPTINPPTMNGTYFNKSPNAIPTISGNVIVSRADPNIVLGAVTVKSAGNG